MRTFFIVYQTIGFMAMILSAVSIGRPGRFDPLYISRANKNESLQSSNEEQLLQREEYILRQRRRFVQIMDRVNLMVWRNKIFLHLMLQPGESLWDRPDVVKKLYLTAKYKVINSNMVKIKKESPLVWRRFIKTRPKQGEVWQHVDLLMDLLVADTERKVKRFNETIWSHYESELGPNETFSQRPDIVEKIKAEYRKQRRWVLVPYFEARYLSRPTQL